jgi:ketosteroid isomerase-like protein
VVGDGGHPPSIKDEEDPMSEATEVVRRLYAALIANDASAIADCLTPDAELKHPGAPPARGGQQLAEMNAQQMSAFTNARFEFHRMIDAGDTVVVEHTFHATHTGPIPGPSGPIAGTGKQIRLDSCDVLQLDGGRVKSFHVYLDMFTMLGQLGLMSTPATSV